MTGFHSMLAWTQLCFDVIGVTKEMHSSAKTSKATGQSAEGAEGAGPAPAQPTGWTVMEVGFRVISTVQLYQKKEERGAASGEE